MKIKLKFLPLFFILIFWSCSGSDNDGTPAPDEDITVTFLSPSASSILSYNKAYDLEAGVNKDVKSVEFLVDGKAVGTVTSRPYKLAWTAKDLDPGLHKITAVAISTQGKEFKKDVEIALKLVLGDDFRGGKIFQLNAAGDHGLIAANTDLTGANGQGTDFVWGAGGTTGTTFENGPENTRKLAAQATDPGQMGHNFKGNGLEMNGFKDWYIPSYFELETLHVNAALVGGFPVNEKDAAYWSSTERNEQQAFFLNFVATKVIFDSKSLRAKVRPIRKF